jgi:hypothetical protein
MSRQPMLYVMEDEGDLSSLLSNRNIERRGPYEFWSHDQDRPVVICAADKLMETICGYQFWTVQFYEGLFSAQQINYALCRVRPRRDDK